MLVLLQRERFLFGE